MTRPARVRRRPGVGEPALWRFPEPVRTRLPNGLDALVVDLPGQHVLSLRVALPAPISGEPPGLEGSTLMMARCLDEGTGSRSATELAELAELHGIALGAGAGEHGLHLGVEVTGRHLGTALDLLVECLDEPTFPEAEVARQVRHRLTDIAHELADPTGRAHHELRQAYYASGDRARVPVGGSSWSVDALTPDVLRARHGMLGPRGGVVVLAGDLSTVQDPVRLLSSTLGSWEPSGPDAPGGPRRAERAPDADQVVLVPRPGAGQTELLLARPGPDRRTPHGWGTYQALSMLFGGAPHARLDRVLREQRGWTYGMRLGFRPRQVGGRCVVGGAVRADATRPALEETLRILDTPGESLEEHEVREAADFVAMTAPARYLTADSVADELVSLVGDGLGPETVTRTLQQVHDLPRGRAAQAWDEVRSGPGWTVVVVGDPDAIAPVAQAGVGRVRTAGPPQVSPRLRPPGPAS
ncbi:pitrilysin family protein [uncultured Serinicoccus sp.]|uniref:M16 family metallopeptidase n=1 Tax=uncultured Serinicoccus sp. TaxID=735514 RepID=UPI0026087BBA|nr:insulinase family protein [uncultured Serinicoccus sp.]